MTRVWILILMSIGISLAHMCDGWKARAGGRERRDAPDASVYAVFEQLRARSVSRPPLGPGPSRSHTLDLEESLQSDTDTGHSARAPLQEADTGETREKGARIPRQAPRSSASHSAHSISKANAPERADRKPAHPKRLIG